MFSRKIKRNEFRIAVLEKEVHSLRRQLEIQERLFLDISSTVDERVGKIVDLSIRVHNTILSLKHSTNGVR
jgi:predicted  nucleic acid-binding Zn-ribbon protein